jgi:hypothetical protein
MRIRPRTTFGTTMSVPGRVKVFIWLFRCGLEVCGLEVCDLEVCGL